SFGNGGAIALFDESRVGGSTSLSHAANLSLDYLRVNESFGRRESFAARLSSTLTPRTTLFTEYTHSRFERSQSWAVNVYLRLELERQQWASSTFRGSPQQRTVEVETGKQLPQGAGEDRRPGQPADPQRAGLRPPGPDAERQAAVDGVQPGAQAGHDRAGLQERHGGELRRDQAARGGWQGLAGAGRQPQAGGEP